MRSWRCRRRARGGRRGALPARRATRSRRARAGRIGVGRHRPRSTAPRHQRVRGSPDDEPIGSTRGRSRRRARRATGPSRSTRRRSRAGAGRRAPRGSPHPIANTSVFIASIYVETYADVNVGVVVSTRAFSRRRPPRGVVSSNRTGSIPRSSRHLPLRFGPIHISIVVDILRMIDECQYASVKLIQSIDSTCCPPVLSRQPLDEAEAERLAAALRVLAEPARLRLLSIISAREGGEACVCDLTEPLGLSQPTVSRRLKVLADAGLVEREQRGRWAYFRVNTEPLELIRGALASLLTANTAPRPDLRTLSDSSIAWRANSHSRSLGIHTSCGSPSTAAASVGPWASTSASSRSAPARTPASIRRAVQPCVLATRRRGRRPARITGLMITAPRTTPGDAVEQVDAPRRAGPSPDRRRGTARASRSTSALRPARSRAS